MESHGPNKDVTLCYDDLLKAIVRDDPRTLHRPFISGAMIVYLLIRKPGTQDSQRDAKRL